MKQLGLASLNYETTKKELPPGHWVGAAFGFGSVAPKHSTISYVLPYMEETAIADQWDFDKTWYHSDKSKSIDNWRLSLSPIPSVVCPSAPTVQERGIKSVKVMSDAVDAPGATAEQKDNTNWPGVTDYTICEQVAATGSALTQLITQKAVRPRPNKKGLYESLLSVAPLPTDPNKERIRPKLSHCTDGLSQTFMWFETGGRPLHYIGRDRKNDDTDGGFSWAQFDNQHVVHDRCGTSMINCHNYEEIYSFHNGGCFFGMGDGAVRFVTESIDPDIFVSFMTRDGDDIIDPSSF